MRDYPPALIELQIEVFDWLAARKDPRIAKNAAGYLVSSIRYKPDGKPGGSALPHGFESKADREKREQQEADAKRQAEEARSRDDQKRREESKAKAREQAERRAARSYWDALTKQEQAALDARAMVEADPKTLQAAELTPESLSLYKTMLRDSYIRKLLQQQEAA